MENDTFRDLFTHTLGLAFIIVSFNIFISAEKPQDLYVLLPED